MATPSDPSGMRCEQCGERWMEHPEWCSVKPDTCTTPPACAGIPCHSLLCDCTNEHCAHRELYESSERTLQAQRQITSEYLGEITKLGEALTVLRADYARLAPVAIELREERDAARAAVATLREQLKDGLANVLSLYGHRLGSSGNELAHVIRAALTATAAPEKNDAG